MANPKAAANELALRDDEYFVVSARHTANVSIRPAAGAGSDFHVTDEVALQLIRALQRHILQHSDYRRLLRAA